MKNKRTKQNGRDRNRLYRPLRIWAILFFLFSFQYSWSQSGNTCSNPVVLGDMSVSAAQTMTGNEMWFSITANRISHNFQIVNLDTINGYVERITLYSSSCASALLYTDAVNPNRRRNIRVLASGLVAGNNYLLKVERVAANPSDADFIVLRDDWTVGTLDNPCDNQCNMLCNGSFEDFDTGGPGDCIYCSMNSTYAQFNTCLNNHCWKALGVMEQYAIPGTCSPDYLNTCQPLSCVGDPPIPHTCEGLAGIYMQGSAGQHPNNLWREFIMQDNINVTVPGVYQVSFWVKRTGGGVNAPIGFWLTQSNVNSLNFSVAQQPTYTTIISGTNYSWTKVTGYANLTATGNYSLIIGDFDNSYVNYFQDYFFIDDVVMNPQPPVISVINNPACSQSPLTFSATTGYNSYFWTSTPVLPGFPSTSNTVVVNPTIPTGYYNVSLYATVPGGCSLDSLTIHVIPAPAASISPAGPITLCTGSSTTLTASTNLPAGIQWYVSSFPSGQGAQSLNCNGCLNITANQTGYYYFTVTDPGNGCTTTSNVVQVTIAQPPSVGILAVTNESCTATNNGSILAGGVGGTAPYTYSWSTSPVQTTALATGLDAGTYTVTVTDANGCTGTAQATIGTDPLPAAPQVSASYGNLPNLCTAGQVITYTVTNYDANLTYVPSFNPTPALAVESPAGFWTVDWGTACTDISITLTAYNGNVICDNSVTLTLPGCCGLCSLTSNDALTDGDSISTVQDLAAAYPALVSVAGNVYTYTNPNGILYVNGNLNVSGGIVFQIVNSEVQLGTNAALVLNDFTTNQIEVSGSHLHASCGDMWKGILANGTNNSIKVNSNSLIEDALWAVQSASGAPYQLKESVFNKNNESVAASQYGANHPGTIENCVFTCRELAPTDNIASTKGNQSAGFIQVFPIANFNTATLLPPYSGKRSYAGVTINRVGLEQLDPNDQLMNVTQIQIGTVGGYDELNVFDNLDFGVFATNSNVEVVNNAFQYITATTIQSRNNPAIIGTAVYGTTNGLYTNKRFITGNLQTNINTFYDCGRGVDLNGYYDVSIRGNRFESTIAYSSLTVFSPIGNLGIFVKSGRYIEVDIMENHIVNCDLGIHFLGDVYQVNNHLFQKYYGYAHIDQNVIEPVLNNGVPNTEYIRNAIIAQNLLPPNCNANCQLQANSPMGRLYIDGNRINNAFNGIHKQGWVRMARCSDDTIHIMQQPADPFGQYLPQQAIRVIDCFEPVEYRNLLTGPGTGQQNIRGIYHTNNHTPYVVCNDVDQVGQCIVFESSNVNAIFWDNSMRSSQDGYVLLNNGKIGTQGSAANANNNFLGDASDNLFYGPFSHADTYTDSTFTPQLHSILFVRAGYPYEPAVNLTSPPGIQNFDSYDLFTGSILIVPGQSPRDCSLPAPIAEGGGDKKVLENIATSLTEETGFVDETRWQDQQRTYEALKSDSTLMDTSVVLQDFYSEMQTSPTELIATIDQKMAADNLSEAASINNTLAAENVIEQNYKVFNAIYLKCIAGDSLTDGAVDSLEALAAQCPLSGGRAVFRARVLLCMIGNTYRTWVDSCDIPPSTARRANPQQTATTVATDNRVQLYPNPNNGQMVLTYSVEGNASFVLYNAMGQVVDTKALLSGEHKMSITENLAPGVYYYQVKEGEKIIKQDKITIIQ